MHRKNLGAQAILVVLIAGQATGGGHAADMHAILKRLRTADCDRAAADASQWRPNAKLDQAASQWSLGDSLRHAIERSGYVPTAIGALHVELADSADRLRLDRASCEVLRNRALREAGVFSRGRETWIVLAGAADLPSTENFDATLERAVMQVNAARQQGRRCGQRYLPSAGPVHLSAMLSDIAAGHARDMATHHYFDHRDHDGHSPADRVRAGGYRERLVGENIAFGPLSAADAVDGWLNSAPHCENLMDPRFKEMGISYARSSGSRPGVYWVQLFADP